jgi:hypothetical protein
MGFLRLMGMPLGCCHQHWPGSACSAYTKAVPYATHNGMAKAISVVKKKRGRPPTGIGTRATIRLHSPELERLDEWAAANGCTRTDALRVALRRLVGLDDDAKPKR